MPGQLFYSTQIPACLWFLARGRKNGKFRNRRGEFLFVDARKMGRMVDPLTVDGQKGGKRMNNLFRFFITVVVLLAVYCFVYWVPMSLIPMMHEFRLSYFISLILAGLAAWYVWKKSASVEAGLVRCILMGAFVIGGIAFSSGFSG